MSNVTTIEFTDTDWKKLSVLAGAVTVQNKGGTPISFVITDVDVLPTDADLSSRGINPSELGGLINEVSTTDAQFIYGKAKSGIGTVEVRPYGTLDPSEDISFLAILLNNVVEALQSHEVDYTNSHRVTKTQIGLSNIPNAISDNPATDNSQILATTKATKELLDLLGLHESDYNNPHRVTADQVGLGNVANCGLATIQEATNSTINNKLITPYTLYRAVQAWIQVALSMNSQLIVNGHMGVRPNLWTYLECNTPTLLFDIKTTTTLNIYAGLQVSFADAGKTRLSTVLADAKTLSLPASHPDGVYYIYCNIGDTLDILDFGMTQLPYKEGNTRNSHPGDFYCVPQNVMYDPTDTPIRRVYIGKCYVNGGQIVSTVSTPIGSQYLFPVTTDVTLGGRDMYENPYCCEVTTVAEVEYNTVWGETKWNDQIGIIASPYPSSTDKIIVQCGLMGFLSCGRESGSPFGANFVTVTTPLRTRVRVRKRFS